MKRFKHRLEYALVYLADAVFNLLPAAVAFRCGEMVGRVFSVILFKRNKLILSNLEQAFPEKTTGECRRITRGVWRNLGRTLAEFLRIPEVLAAPEKYLIEWKGTEHVDKALADKKGVVLVAAHFTNWEMLGVAIKIRWPKFTAIARPMKNPFVESWLQSKRGSGGMDIILHRNAVRASLKWVKGGNIIGILVDQNLYTGGEFVKFFGRPAATTTLPAILHARTGAPVIPTYCLRDGTGFRFFFEPPVFPPAGVSEDEQIKAHTQEISNRFEQIIRRTPQNWFWIHNRWKRKV